MAAKRDDFQKCMVNPMVPASLKKLKTEHPVFDYTPGKLAKDDMLWKYIVLMYDINSPMRDKYQHLQERKVRTAMYVGYEVNLDNRFHKDIENMLTGNVPRVNKMIIRYIIMHGRPELMKYVSYTEMLATETEKSLQAYRYDSRQLKDMRVNIDQITDELEKIYLKLFGGDDLQSLKDQLYSTVQEDRFDIRPEEVAINLAKNLFSVNTDPYEVGDINRIDDQEEEEE